jgi:SAM-dependent methyltransferase
MQMEISEMKPAGEVFDGIPVLLRHADLSAELARDPKLEMIIRRAKDVGWKQALEGSDEQENLRYVLDTKRSDFLKLLPLDRSMKALEIGCSIGIHTPAIASKVSGLDAMDLRLLNVVFAKLKCEQEGIRNVNFFCGGDDCTLPFESDAYDAVILNLVLEWCGGHGPHSQLLGQKTLLREIARVLKPGGYAQINTKNRYSYRLLTGGRDEHTENMRFGQALPRWLLKLLRGGKPEPAGLLHSYGALRRLLRECGLQTVDTYWTIPEMRFPTEFVRLDAKEVRAAKKRLSRISENRRTEFFMRQTPAPFVKHFTPGLFFIARA